MNVLLKHLTIIFIILLFFAMAINVSGFKITEHLSNNNRLTTSFLGTVSAMFPRKSKGVKTKLPVERDNIEDVQKLEKDVLKYLGG